MSKDFKDKDKDTTSGKEPKLGTTSKDEIMTGKKRSKSKFNKKKFPNKGRINDPNWYVANSSIVRDVASLPYAVYNGVTYDRYKPVGITNIIAENAVSATRVPGVAIYKYVPWYGTSTPTSALNLTMRAMYSFVRHVNSGRTNYEAPDLTLYIMAMDNIYLLIHEIKRMIRLAYYYSLENRDIPERIYAALGIDISNVVDNLANYRAQLNVRISKANTLAVPANFNLFKRRAVLGSVVLTDEPNRPTQLIIPQSDGFYKFNPTHKTGGALEFVKPWSHRGSSGETENGDIKITVDAKITLNNYLALLDDLLSVLLANEDINIMSGDIIKAYGNDLFTIPYLKEEEIQEISHDEDLLLQFSNSSVLDIPYATIDPKSSSIVFDDYRTGQSAASATPVISQYNGSLVARCYIDTAKNRTGEKWTALNQIPFIMQDTQFIETSKSKEVSPESTMEWTRLMMTSVSHYGTAQWNIEAGVEIGLGWLVATPGTYWAWKAATVNKIIDTSSVIVQWFQSGIEITPGFKLEIPEVNPSTYGEINSWIVTLYQEDTPNDGTIAVGHSTRMKNIRYVSAFIDGLAFGPKRTGVAGIDYTSGDVVKLYVDGSIARLQEKTALASRQNIQAMHDAALLGLISSPYITNKQ